MMTGYRNNPPEKINDSQVIKINDYEKQISHDLLKGTKSKISLIKSDVLQFFLADGTKISVRPSGTEPKIKFYFSVNTKLASADKFDETENILDKRINDIITDMKLL
jgi:phosphoglucomutase